MVRITEASESDFEQVYRLLQLLDNTTIVRGTWQRALSNPFQGDGSPGYILKDGEDIVGFFGTIFSCRSISGKKVKFCNCHSWIVDEKYRTMGLMLLNKIHKLKDHLLTICSASSQTYKIYKMLKWKEVDSACSMYRVNPLHWLFRSSNNILRGSEMEPYLNQEERRIYQDHKQFRCDINYLKTDDSGSLQVFKRITYLPSRIAAIKDRLPVSLYMGQLYYCSNPAVFFKDFRKNLVAICKKEKWVGMIVPNRMLQKAGIPPGKKYYGSRSILVRSDLDIDHGQIDLLYSEIFVLDLN